MPHLTYQRASRHWLDRLPLGDGRLGAMVGADETARRIGLNESSAWSGGTGSARSSRVAPEVAAEALAEARRRLLAGDPVVAERALMPLQHRYPQAFLPVGELVVREIDATPVTSIRRDLDLATGTHRVEGAGLTATTVISSKHSLLMHSESYERVTDVEITFTSPLRTIHAEWSDAASTVTLGLPADVAPGHEPDEPPLVWEAPGIAPLSVVVSLSVRHDGARIDTTGSVRLRGVTRVDVVAAIETTFTGMGCEPGSLPAAAARATTAAMTCPPAETALSEHVEAFRARAGRFAIEFATAGDGDMGGSGVDADLRVDAVADAAASVTESDPALLALLAHYGAYLLRASSRAGGVPANLQGIWNDHMQPPWSSAFTLNINTPMNYWAAEAIGASDAHLALLEFLEALAAQGADTAWRLYGARGWVAHHNSDLWGYSLPTRGDASWAHWPMGGAWLVRQFDEHRRHGAMDDATRARFWPIARGCARFLLDWIVDIDGVPGTAPSTSPENRYLIAGGTAALTTSSAMDRALIREVFALVIRLADDVGEPDDDVAVTAREVLGRIPPARSDSRGRVAEWGEDHADEDPHHRHVSHLYEWFPGDGGAADLDGAAARTLDARGDDSTGWSLAWKIALRARLGDAEAVGRLLDLVVRPAETGSGAHRGGLYPNLFAAHPPFQIDGNLGYVGALLEVLVQSHRPGVLELLPALPTGLDAGLVRGLIARPGIEVDLQWHRGRPTRITLRACHRSAAGPLRIVHGGEDLVVIVPVTGTVELAWPAAHTFPPNDSDRSIT